MPGAQLAKFSLRAKVNRGVLPADLGAGTSLSGGPTVEKSPGRDGLGAEAACNDFHIFFCCCFLKHWHSILS